MSYLASSPRSFDPQAQQDFAQPISSHVQRQQQQQQHQIPLSAYHTFPSPHQPGPTSPSASQISPYATDQSSSNLPKVGQTRCYWALLTSELLFIYLDPVLAKHLGEQAECLIGKRLLDYVHPDEQTSAKQDLAGVLESRTLHGSVTRVRFSRLSSVRRQLGYTGSPPPWGDSENVVVDSHYMVVDIVINWAAEGLVLCFIHGIADLDTSDNDEQHKTGRTNWCGTPQMSEQDVQILYGRLISCAPRPPSLSRVFQILGHGQGRPLLISWPPDQGAGPSGRDFANLVENVQIGNGMPNGTDAKTSCTRRYKALQNMPSIVGGQVESIFIPHGSIIFACHKVEAPSRSAVNSGATMQQLGYSPMNYGAQSTSYYDQQASSYALPPVASAAYNSSYMSQPASQVQTSYSPQRWSPQVAIPPASVSNLLSASDFPSLPQPTQQWQGTPYVDTNASPTAYGRPVSPAYTYSPTTPATTTGGSVATSPTTDVVPPPRRRVSPGSAREQYSGTGRNASNRPTGVLKCSSCKATSSPEWRKGPTGKKELCNACGLRYARSRAKKEGHTQAQRRRKDKGITKRESATPPTSASPSYSAVRRSFGESSFSTSSAGSASGSDIYPHSGNPMFDNSTPSPSPPASNMNFVHYNPAGDSRPPYSSSTSTFYSAPSPLSNSTLLHAQEQSAPPTQLPPLGQMSAYVDRVSSMVPSGSPISNSPLTSTLPAASFERERERERERELRELPPTPLTAEPRHTRRSLLSQQ